MLVPVLVVSPAARRIRSNADLENSWPLPDDVLHQLHSVIKDGASVAAWRQAEIHLLRSHRFDAKGTVLLGFNRFP